MSDDTDTTAIIDSDAVEVDVADDPTESMTIVTGLTVSASEKVSTGDYENYEPYQSARVSFSPPIDVSEPAGRVEVRKRAMSIHADIQADLTRSINNRMADPDLSNWPEGVDTPPVENSDE